MVAPFVGAWIEMLATVSVKSHGMSLRSSERGLKYYAKYLTPVVRESLRSSERGLKYMHLVHFLQHKRVAPFVGAWIEIEYFDELGCRDFVAPFVGAWIEIVNNTLNLPALWSLRSSERGLKYAEVLLALPAVGRSVRRSVD